MFLGGPPRILHLPPVTTSKDFTQPLICLPSHKTQPSSCLISMLSTPLAIEDKGLGSQFYHEEEGGEPWEQLP